MKTLLKYSIVPILIFGSIGSIFSQNTSEFRKDEFTMQIVLDKKVDVAGLTLYPGVKDKNSYWYLPEKLKLAKNEDGTPKFSLIKWVYNEESDTDEGIGGGVLHCVFGFEITREEVEKAQEELRGINSKGKIIGSVTYKSGVVNVSVPRLNDPDSHEYLGETKAPIMDNSFIALNLLLDKRSTSLLWDSFDTPNPVVTFNFDMILAGYNSPIEAKITMDYEKIFNSKKFQAGMANAWATGDINTLVKESMDNGAITVEKIGSNFKQEKAIDAVIKLATDALFQPDLGALVGSSTSQDNSKPASVSKAFVKRKEVAIARREKVTKSNKAKQRANKTRRIPSNKSGLTSQKIDVLKREVADAKIEYDKTVGSQKKAALRSGHIAKDPKANEKTKSIAKKRAKDAQSKVELAKRNYDSKVKALEKTKTESNENKPTDVAVTDQNLLEELPTIPSIQVALSYSVKKERRTGKKEITFKESYPVTLPAPFGGNLGVSRLDCPKCFVETNLDDDVFKQREIVTVLDGLNENDFVKYINYGTVQLRKKHESGKITYKEVRITRQEYKKEGNMFKMIYGWKGDNDRSNWFKYDYHVDWSFFGGNDIVTDWVSTNRSVITLSPPIHRKIITVSAEKELLIDSNVRLVNVKIYYNLGGNDLVKQFTVNPKSETLSGAVEFMLPVGMQDYDYEITWRLFGNKEVKSKRKTTSSEILFVDELPN